MTPSEYNLSKVAYSVAELTELLPLGRTKLYAAVKRGELRPTKYGARTLFLAADVAAFLDIFAGKAA